MLVRMCYKENIPSLLVRVETHLATIEINMTVPQKTGNLPTSKPSNTTLGYIPKRWLVPPHGHFPSTFIIHNGKKFETTLKQIMDKENVVCYPLEYYSAARKKMTLRN